MSWKKCASNKTGFLDISAHNWHETGTKYQVWYRTPRKDRCTTSTTDSCHDVHLQTIILSRNWNNPGVDALFAAPMPRIMASLLAACGLTDRPYRTYITCSVHPSRPEIEGWLKLAHQRFSFSLLFQSWRETTVYFPILKMVFASIISAVEFWKWMAFYMYEYVHKILGQVTELSNVYKKWSAL